jgi:membrane protease subunit HflK
VKDMSFLSSLAGRAAGLFSDSKGPWGAPPPKGGKSSGKGSGGNEPSEPTPGPWGNEPPRRSGSSGSSGVTSLDEFLERNRKRFGGGGPFGGGGGVGGGFSPDRSIYVWAIVGLIALWLLFTTFHRIAPEERGVVSIFGRYNSTLSPGVSMTLPAPIASVQKVNVAEIRNVDIGDANAESLMLTGDQNIIDIAYRVTWSIRDPEQFLFELRTPEDTIRQVAESSMRQVVAQVSLNDAIGPKRGEIEALVREEMQQTLDRYDSGVIIRNISIRQADPPAAVNEAFKDVTAAQQDAESEINKANAYALQLRQLAQGEATAFDKVYEQYRLAPEVTRRRMYYETMERVLRNVEKTIVETPGVTPYLPLNQIPRQRPTEPAQPQASTGGGQ